MCQCGCVAQQQQQQQDSAVRCNCDVQVGQDRLVLCAAAADRQWCHVHTHFLIRVAGGHCKHVALVAKHLGPVPLTRLHAVLEMVLIVGVEGLNAGTHTRTRQNTTARILWGFFVFFNKQKC